MVSQTLTHEAVPFALHTNQHDDSLDLALWGELDLACSDMLDPSESESAPGISKVTVDIRELDFIDTTGVRALLGLRSRNLSLGRSVELVNPSALVTRVMTLFGRADVLEPS